MVQDHFTARQYGAERQYGPLSFLNPTTRLIAVERSGKRRVDGSTGRCGHDTATSDARLVDGETGPSHDQVFTVWTSRNNRKGRHAVAVAPGYHHNPAASAPPATNTLREAFRGITKMLVRYPLWDVSYDVAIVFTLGSLIWCINGFFVWLPLQDPWTEFDGEESVGGGVTALVGATVFEIGSILLMLEAVNENTADCFGWALEEALEDATAGVVTALRPEQDCHHSHAEKRGLFLKRCPPEETANSSAHLGLERRRIWSWWPSWYELRTHYFRDIGFLACLSQMTGATIFWIAGFTGLPPIYDSLSTPVLNGIYWLPQVVGGTGFIISSWLFMLETQSRWYIPSLQVLGWHVGFWNLVGAIGFTLCGALGFGASQPAVEYAASLSTFIGSWAFLIGSVIQWFESLDKYPLSVDKRIESLTAPGPVASGSLS